MYNKGCHFNAIVNNADFFSGHIYSDNGVMYWGTIMQRGSSSDNCTMYKCFSSGGADSVTPFKSGSVLVALAGYGCGGGNYGTNNVVLDSSYISCSVSGTGRAITFTIKKTGKYRITSTGLGRGGSNADGSIVVAGTTIMSGKYNSDLLLNNVYSLSNGQTIVINSASAYGESFTAGTIAISFEG